MCMLSEVVGSLSTLTRRLFPSWDRRGGRAIKTLERRGRSGHSGLTTPSALSNVASQHFLDAQPSPPVPGGDYASLIPGRQSPDLPHRNQVCPKWSSCKSQPLSVLQCIEVVSGIVVS